MPPESDFLSLVHPEMAISNARVLLGTWLLLSGGLGCLRSCARSEGRRQSLCFWRGHIRGVDLGVCCRYSGARAAPAFSVPRPGFEGLRCRRASPPIGRSGRLLAGPSFNIDCGSTASVIGILARFHEAYEPYRWRLELGSR